MSTRSAARTNTGRRSSSSWIPTRTASTRTAGVAVGRSSTTGSLPSSRRPRWAHNASRGNAVIDPAAQVGLEKVGDRLDAVGAGAEAGLDGGNDSEAARRSGLAAHADDELGVTDGDLDGVPGRRHRRPGDQAGQLAEPRGAAGGVGEHIVEPCGDRPHADGRELLDGQGRDGGARPEPEQGGQRLERASRRGGLCPYQAEHEVQRDVVELVEAAEAEVEVPRRTAGQLERTELEPDRGVVVVAGRRHVERHRYRAEVELVGCGRRAVEVQRAGDSYAPTAVAEEQHGIGRGGVAAAPRGGARCRAGSRWRAGPERRWWPRCAARRRD